MIERITDATQVPPANVIQKDAGSQTVTHTLFGDVFLDEMSTPNFAALFGGRPPATTVASNTAVAPETVAASEAATPETYEMKSVSVKLPVFVAGNTNPNACPTAESIFGAQVFENAPTGHGPNNTFWSYNPTYFATRQTAEIVAQMVGGIVVERNAICPSGPMVQDQVNRIIVLPDGRELNAGLVADIYAHGRSQAQVDQMLKEEVRGAYDPSSL